MSAASDSTFFPWEEEPSARAEPQTHDADDSTAYDPNCEPPIPAEVAPDEAAERVHQEDFSSPEEAAPAEADSSPEAAAPGEPDSDAEEGAAADQRTDAAGTPPVRRSETSRPLVRKEYYAISEVSDLVGLPAHVLRYWESQFSVLNPSKNRSGNRVYQRKEIRLILLVKQLLYEDKYTVEGAKQKLDQLRRGGTLQDASSRALSDQMIATLREDLRTLSELLSPDAG